MQAIKVENLSKLYHLGEKKHDSLRDTISSLVGGLGQRKKRELWALKDINFEVNEGETLGVVGKNGAGKSTLLKILSRITRPTSGKALLRGRVGSLLEIGTGFHQELSGRENIYMSGAVLGMTRKEIDRAFDEIVAFSEVEKFLDTPVKHFSSGMYMRLAFAVAAHLEPEVLIVDEVLAVGDAAFQRKCLNKMRDVSNTGRTVLFVSHDMSAITRICDRAIALKSGQLVLDGSAADVVRDYLHSDAGIAAETDYSEENNPPGNEIVTLRKIRVADTAGETSASHDIRNPIQIEATYEVLENGQIMTPVFTLQNAERATVFVTQDLNEDWRNTSREKGTYKSTVTIPGNYMAEGSFFVTFHIASYLPSLRTHLTAREAVSFDIIDSIDGDSARGDYAGPIEGIVRPILPWKTDFQP
jgi:lipopolysaccharide transport system ATP-binding protein